MKLTKAQATTLMAIILVLAVGLALGGLTYKYVVQQKHKTDIEVCKASIALAAKSKEELGLKSPLTKVKCKRHSWVFDKETDDEINKAIAEAAYNCIYVSHAGKLNWAEAATISWRAGKSFCIHCDNFKFRGNAQKNYDTHSIYPYFSTHNPPKWPQTYFEYFEDVTREGDFYLDFNKWKDLDTDKTYELFFARYNLPWAHEWLNKLDINPDIDICLSHLVIAPALAVVPGGIYVTKIKATCVGPVIATTNMAKDSMQSFVRFTPAENIKDCDVWLN